MLEKLDESNFMIYAAQHYDNPQCLSTSEFMDDMSRFKYLKKLFSRYADTGELKERLILNHLIVLYNCFDTVTTKMLFVKMPDYARFLKPFLVYLNRMPEKIEIENVVIDAKMITEDQKIVELLKCL